MNEKLGVYGHALVGEDARTAEKINGLFERIVAPDKTHGK